MILCLGAWEDEFIIERIFHFGTTRTHRHAYWNTRLCLSCGLAGCSPYSIRSLVRSVVFDCICTLLAGGLIDMAKVPPWCHVVSNKLLELLYV